MPSQEVRGKLRNVVASQPKGRHVNIDATEPVVQVRAEQPACHELRQGTVGRRDDARVDPARARAAHSLHGQVLDGAQQFRLRREREVRHFVEKQRARVGVFELAASPPHPGGRPILNAEELSLKQRFHHRCTIHRDERPGASPAQLVDLGGRRVPCLCRFHPRSAQ